MTDTGTLARLEDHGLVDREKRAGPHGADVYQDAGADAAIVDLGGTTNDALLDSNRWSLAIHDRHAREEDAAPPASRPRRRSTPSARVTRPPIPATDAADGRAFDPVTSDRYAGSR